MKKGVGERSDECLGHIEKMGNDRIAKRVYVEECIGSRLVCRRGRAGIIQRIIALKKGKFGCCHSKKNNA